MFAHLLNVELAVIALHVDRPRGNSVDADAVGREKASDRVSMLMPPLLAA